MLNARDYIALEFGGMHDGETRAGNLCPSCEGGSTRERTLSVTKREGVLLWQCHRDSCGFKGATGAARSASTSPATKVPDTRGVVGRTLARYSDVVGSQAQEYLASHYGISRSHISKYEIGWDHDTDRLVIPVKNFAGESLGSVLRSLSGAKPKSKSHTEKDAISWFVNHTSAGVIIVEDQFSAIRASDYLTSVALLGTHLNDERVQEIRDSGLSPVYLALDADAWGTAIKYAVRYRSALGLRLIKLNKDIKDQSNQELRETLNFLPSLRSDSYPKDS